MVEGIFDKSIEKEYEDGDKVLMNYRYAIHYQAQPGAWEDHWVIQTNTDKYFMCLSSERVQ